MKKLLLLCVCTFMVANAALIPSLNPVDLDLGVGGTAISLGGGGTEYSYLYTAQLNDSAQFRGSDSDNEYFVLYDFSGFDRLADVIPGPTSNWMVSTSATGPDTPGITVPMDDPTIPNLVFRYGGAESAAGSAWVFDVRSTVGAGFTMSHFASSATNAQLANTYVRNWGNVLVPAPGGGDVVIPEPFTMGLIGGGLAGLGLLRRFRKS
jgi:hypothetical protein